MRLGTSPLILRPPNMFTLLTLEHGQQLSAVFHLGCAPSHIPCMSYSAVRTFNSSTKNLVLKELSMKFLYSVVLTELIKSIGIEFFQSDFRCSNNIHAIGGD